MRKTVSKLTLQTPSMLPHILASLKQQYRARGIKYRDVAKLLKISEITVKRYLSGQALTVEMLERLCEIAELSLFDLLALARDADQTEQKPLTMEQQERLAREPFLSVMYFLLRRGWTVDELQREFSLGEAELNRMLTAMDSLDLIDLYPYNKVRVKAGRATALRGPLRRIFRSMGIQRDMADFDPESDEMNWWFNYFKFSPASLDQVKKLSEKFHAAVLELSQNDHRTPGAAAKWYCILNLVRPFDHDKYRPISKR
jgi:transcriptional regulator with XRE-family HTH domain